jgi:salicylate hydroxylase
VSRDPVIVVGAGIGGLACALALRQRGIDVEVYEQAPKLREIGAGVQLSANGTRVLRALGLEPALDAWAVRPQAKEIRHWKSGRTWKLFDLGVVSEQRYGAPYIFIHRADLHRILADALQVQIRDGIHLNARCVGVEQDADAVTLRLEDGRSARGRLLIGADGVHSAVRASVFGAGRPEFTGCMAWRGVIPRDRLPQGRIPQAGTNWIGPGRHVVHYPLRRGEVLNFVGVVERGDWLIESWTAQGTRGECLADFAGWHPDVRALIEAIDVPYKWALMARSAMTRWSEGRVTLLGDACHAVPRPGCRHGDRGRLRARALPGGVRRGLCQGLCALRGGPHWAHDQGRRRLRGQRQALPQPASGRRPRRWRLHHHGMERGEGRAALRLAVHLRCPECRDLSERLAKQQK